MKFELDKHDFQLIYKSICYFDMYEDGKYHEWFGKDADKVNESFHYLYSLSGELSGEHSK
tara:strand:+ start:548 stop:727 length:180 start_codon:yes stop_codon:yes gene_type:complete